MAAQVAESTKPFFLESDGPQGSLKADILETIQGNISEMHVGAMIQRTPPHIVG